MDMSHEFNPSGEGLTASKITKPRPGGTEQRIAAFSSRLAEIRVHARKAAWLPIDQKIQELDSRKGILKIPVALASRLLDRQKGNIQRQLEQADKIKPDKIQRERVRLPPYKEIKPLRQNEEDSLLAVGEEIRTITDDYDQLSQEIIQDGIVSSEVREAHIQELVLPEVDRLVRGTNLTQVQKGEFYSALYAYLDHKDEPDSMKQPYRKELDRFMPGNYKLESYCNPLLEGSDTTVIHHLIAKIAATDIKAIQTSVLLQLKSKDLKKRFLSIYSDIFDEGLDPISANISPFVTHLRLKLQGRIKIPDMQIWQSLKSSKTANEIFGEAIKDQDQENYTTALEASISDTKGWDPNIELLSYYPTPDAIRNLVVLVANSNRNISANASRTLKNLTERADWRDLLGKAVEVYPSLKTVGSLLSDPKYYDSSDGYRHKITEESQDLVLSIVENNASDPKLKEKSTRALTAHSILGILTKKGVIQPTEVTMLNKILEQPQGDFHFFPYDLKNDLLELMRGGKTKDEVRQRLEIIKRFETLSRITLENDSNNQAEVYLKDQFVIKKLQDTSLKQEDVKIFLEAFKTVPALTTKRGELNSYELKYNLCWEFVKQFKGNETIQLFNDLSASYSPFPDLLLHVAISVGNSDISRERALELPSKASDIFQAGFFPVRFLTTDKDIEFFKKMIVSYDSHKQNIGTVSRLVLDNRISRERALELPAKASDILGNPLLSLAMEFPSRFLATDQGAEFFRNMLVSYQSNVEDIKLVASALENSLIANELALAFPEQASALMQDKMKETKIFIWKNGETMLRDTSDLKFLNRLVGEFGQKADSLIRGYQECLEAGVVTNEEKELVLEFAKQFRVVAPATLAGYKKAKEGGLEKGYIAQLKSLAEKMTGSGTITEEEKSKPYYKDLLKHVYANNAGQWSSFESNDSCADRSDDLAGFKINPRYEIDLLSQSEIRIKAGETQDHSIQDEVQQPILGVAEKMSALGHDKEKINLALKKDIDKTLKEIIQQGGLQEIDLSSLTSTEEKMFLILTDSIYGTRSIDSKRVKDLVIAYEFAVFEDISDYIAGTRDRVGRANNQDYALLCEVGAFYSDRIKEVNRRLVETAYKNPQIATLMPQYFRQLSQDTTATQKQDRINRLQIERLGASESFVKQLTRVLDKRRGRKYEAEEVKEIIRRYEGLTGGLQEKGSVSQNPQTRAFYGQLRSQRERTFEALQVITGEKVDPQKVHLGEINLQQALEAETGIKEGKYDSDQFASYTAQRFIDLFEDERIKIEGELAKFESISGKQREVLYGYITKSKESANARMVGGVCVAGDNPSKNKDHNMWDMPNYFQLVFQEPDTLQCQGLVLLHHFTQDGKRVLAASLNPSSTYLYSVDETALFNGVMGTLERFAKDNNFDMITFSQNKTIRTNRTVGQFEKTMDARIASVGNKFRFSSPQTFSYSPNYQLQDMDVAWERKG